MTHCTEGLTVVARGGAVSWHTALRALLWWLEVELCHDTYTALRALLWWLEVELCHDTLH